MTQIRVFIADDHPLIIEGLTTALTRCGIDVVGSTTLAADVLAGYQRSRPDVLVLDVRFGEGTTGLDIAREQLAFQPNPRIVFYSQYDQDEVIREAYRIGGEGFVLKSMPPETVADAIRQVHEGKTHFLPQIAERLALIGVRGDDTPRAKLDTREFEVFRLLALAKTNAEIGEELGLSLKTISSVSQSVKDKLGVQRTGELTRLAIRHKIIEA